MSQDDELGVMPADPAAVRAACERLGKFEGRATAYMQERSTSFSHAHAINMPVTREDIEALRIVVAALSAQPQTPPMTVSRLAEVQGLTGAHPNYRALATAAFSADEGLSQEAQLARVLSEHVLKNVWASDSRGYHIAAFRCRCQGWGESRDSEGWAEHVAAAVLHALDLP